ncbi:MAG: BrnT family toxin [Candidatus Thiodiazotropha sp. (ex Lucinoma kastoroae)]|nr:BrnT family toxin [Candidatus Thiodiazotropha sp. (ex Lucinoma kastoroae)]
MQYNFERDPVKATINTNKHGVTFEQAIEAFKDPMALTLHEDEESTSDEDRWVTVGLVNHKHYLLVVHTYHDQNGNGVTIRVISARRATKHEIKQYEHG